MVDKKSEFFYLLYIILYKYFMHVGNFFFLKVEAAAAGSIVVG